MMTTLLRHQFRSTWTTLGSVVGVMVLVALVSLVAPLLRLPVIGALGLGVGTGVACALLPVVLVLLVVDYWQSMYGRRGYFTMSLPVRGRELFTAKVLHALVCAVAATVVALAVGLLCMVARARMGRVSVADTLDAFRQQIDALPAGTIWWVVAAALVYLATLVVQVAGAVSVSARGRFNHLGAGAPVVALVILYLVNQVTNLAGMLWIPLGIRLQGPDAGTLVARGMWSGFVEAVRIGGQPEVLGLGALVTCVVVAAILAWWGVRSIERHTSLR